MLNQDESWHEPGVKALEDPGGRYDALQEARFAGIFEPVPVVYNDIYENWRNTKSEGFTRFSHVFSGCLALTESVNAKTITY